MLERLERRAVATARARAQQRARRLAEALRQEAPEGIGVAADERGVVLSGRGLARRLALDAALRWLTERVR